MGAVVYFIYSVVRTSISARRKLLISFVLSMGTTSSISATTPNNKQQTSGTTAGESNVNNSRMEKVKLVHGVAADTSCELYLFGATLTSWVVEGQEVIFVASKAKLDGSKAIRGGIPICFPAFGAWEFGPQHGFARNSKGWRVAQQPQVDPDTGDVEAVLELSDSEESRKMWNKKFVLRYTIRLEAACLQLEASVKNLDEDTEADLDVAFCFHTYLKVPDVTQCQVDGLKGVTFVDKTEDGHPVKTEDRDAVTISGFTDRVYRDAPDTVSLTGLANDKMLKFEKIGENFSDYVVWNPWTVNKLGDMGEEDYKSMICVEAAAFSRGVKIPANQTWKGVHKIHLQSKL